MKNIFLAAWLLQLSTAALSWGNEKVFQQIADQAPVANGSARVEKYNSKLGKADLVASGLKELKDAYWDNCGPWKTFKTRRKGIERIAAIESSASEGIAAQELKKLYVTKELVAIVGAESNEEIECSLAWYNVYGADGTVLKLRYNMGD